MCLGCQDASSQAKCSKTHPGVDGSPRGGSASDQQNHSPEQKYISPILFITTFPPAHQTHSLAYAALSFNRDNNFDAHIYSVGASLFFVSFCLFQVPSNLIMVRVGFRPWLSCSSHQPGPSTCCACYWVCLRAAPSQPCGMRCRCSSLERGEFESFLWGSE